MVNDPLVKPAFPGGKRGIQGVFLAPEEFKMMQFFKGYTCGLCRTNIYTKKS